MKCVPSIAPVGKRRPGGKDVPVIDRDRSLMVKSDPEVGENTSSSRCTFVNCMRWDSKRLLHGVRRNAGTYVVVAEEIDITRMIIGWGCGVREVDQSILGGELFGCARVSREPCAGRAEFGCVRAIVDLLLGESNGEI